jgi:hypothetical protein
MSLDISYTTEHAKYPNNKGVYHVLYLCPHSRFIEEGHRKQRETPPAGRRPCKTCLAEIGDWLKSLQTRDRPSWFLPEA